MEIKLPKNSTGGDKDTAYVMPEGLSTDASNKIWSEILTKIVDKENELQERVLAAEAKIEEYKKEIEKQAFRNIEIIGIFSAVLALLIVDVSVIKSATSFLAAILLITSLAAVVAMFALLIHILFAPEDKYRITWKAMWVPLSILIIFIILGIVAQHLGWMWALWSGGN